jgi:hypothetical protein
MAVSSAWGVPGMWYAPFPDREAADSSTVRNAKANGSASRANLPELQKHYKTTKDVYTERPLIE